MTSETFHLAKEEIVHARAVEAVVKDDVELAVANDEQMMDWPRAGAPG